MKIEYKINKFDPDSCNELITIVHCTNYGFKCKGKVYTSNGELEKNHIVSAKIKMICNWVDKDGDDRKTTFYDSTIKELTEQTIHDFIEFELKYLYGVYKKGQ